MQPAVEKPKDEDLPVDADLRKAAYALLAAAETTDLREKLRMISFALHVLGSQP